MNFANTSLFVGDLPKFCSETDLEQLFSPYGVLLDAKIKRNGTTGKTLSYGFVTYASETSAQEALKNMDGAMFSGRKLRVRWAMYNAKGTTSTPGSQSQLINSVYVRFVTPMLDRYITEEDLHFVFDSFGNVVDASIKESSIDHRLGRQSGYGFVHFTCDQGGIESAFKAVNAVDNANISNVVYNVELSKNLLKLFGEYQQQQQQLGATSNPSMDTALAINSSPQKVSPGALPSPPLSLSMAGSGSSAETLNMSALDLRYSPRAGQPLQQSPSPSISPAPLSSHTNSFMPLPQYNNSNNNSQYLARSGAASGHRAGPLRAASFHDMNSVRNAAAFQQQMQFQQQQLSAHSMVSPPQQQYLMQQSQHLSPSYFQPQSALGDCNMSSSEMALDTLSDMDMIRMGLAIRQQQQQQLFNNNNNMNNNLMFQSQTNNNNNNNNNNKLYATRSASRISSIPTHISPQSFAGNAYGTNINHSNNNNFNLARIGGTVNFPPSPSNSTVQYDYRAVTGNTISGRKFTFDGSHADTVPLDGNGSLSKFNSSDSSDRNIIIASQSSDVFRSLGVKPNSFMSNSQGSLFSLTENNITMGVGNAASNKSLKRGNSNMSEVSVETELDVTHLALDQKLLTSKELDDFLFSASSPSANNNNSNNISNNNSLSQAANALLGSPDHIAAPALIGSPAILRDGIASRLEETNANNNNMNIGGSVKLPGMFPPPIGSPVVMDQQHRSRQNSSTGNSTNVSRISSFTLNNGNSNANANNNSNNNNMSTSILGGDDLRTGTVEDSFLASNSSALPFNNLNTIATYNNNSNTSNLRFSVEQMSLGSALDTNPSEFSHLG